MMELTGTSRDRRFATTTSLGEEEGIEMDIDITHDRDRLRFVARLDGKEANLQYSQADEKTLDYESTFVPEEYRKRGIGERIVLEALGFARENGYDVIPSCPFVRHVLEDHSEYGDVVAGK